MLEVLQGSADLLSEAEVSDMGTFSLHISCLYYNLTSTYACMKNVSDTTLL